jgi:hypothetical protein
VLLGFEELSVLPPSILEDVPSVIEKLQERKVMLPSCVGEK